MKKYFLGFLLVSSQSLVAATVTVGNVNELSDTNAIVLSDGTAIGSGEGSIQIGYFVSVSDADVAVTSLSALVADFKPYGNVVDFGAFSTDGLFQGDISGVTLDGSLFANKNIYVMVTNSSAGFTSQGVTSANQFLVWDANIAFPNSEPFSGSINVQNGALGALAKGGYNNYTVDFGEGNVAAYNLVTVPEPSAALLGGLGALALLRRRRVA